MNRISLAIATLLAALTVGALAALPAAAATRPTSLAQLRAVTAKYADVRVALANGYRRASPCVVSPQGTMGFHYIHPRLATTPTIIVRQPEILLYVPQPGGGLRLVGVEYWKADPDQRLTTAVGRPMLWGKAFHGPMKGHAPDMPVHFDLHVWLFAPNPRGLFADFNPTVSC